MTTTILTCANCGAHIPDQPTITRCPECGVTSAMKALQLLSPSTTTLKAMRQTSFWPRSGDWWWVIDEDHHATGASLELASGYADSQDAAYEAGEEAAFKLGLCRVGGDQANGYSLARCEVTA